jgi:hypothetical protein
VIKPENLLVKKGNDTHVMLSDFGLSRILGDDSMASTACGTPYYVGKCWLDLMSHLSSAPEILKAQSYHKEVVLSLFDYC